MKTGYGAVAVDEAGTGASDQNARRTVPRVVVLAGAVAVVAAVVCVVAVSLSSGGVAAVNTPLALHDQDAFETGLEGMMLGEAGDFLWKISAVRGNGPDYDGVCDIPPCRLQINGVHFYDENKEEVFASGVATQSFGPGGTKLETNEGEDASMILDGDPNTAFIMQNFDPEYGLTFKFRLVDKRIAYFSYRTGNEWKVRDPVQWTVTYQSFQVNEVDSLEDPGRLAETEMFEFVGPKYLFWTTSKAFENGRSMISERDCTVIAAFSGENGVPISRASSDAKVPMGCYYDDSKSQFYYKSKGTTSGCSVGKRCYTFVDESLAEDVGVISTYYKCAEYMNKDECKAFASANDKKYYASGCSGKNCAPKGCYIYTNGNIYWNDSKEGDCSMDRNCICKVGSYEV